MNQVIRIFLVAGPWVAIATTLTLIVIQDETLAKQGVALAQLRAASIGGTAASEASEVPDLRARLGALEARIGALESAALRRVQAGPELAALRERDADYEGALQALRADVDALLARSEEPASASPIQRALGPIAPLLDGLGAVSGQGPLADVQRLSQLQADRGRLARLDATVPVSDEEREELALALDAWRREQLDVSGRLTRGELSRADAKAALERSRDETRRSFERILGSERFANAEGVFPNLRPH